MSDRSIVIITPEELSELISHAVNDALHGYKPAQPKIKRKWIFIQEVMEITGLAKQTIYGLSHKKAIPHFKHCRKLHFKKR